ncbi:hypothetical protein ACIQAA_27475 [Neobacillus sp. NPDC093182]|uniref:hypothetical protein n=1 Tax=Neobacillus sp. NPDC093182 TaxID=3364297 RepID=UPI003808A64E
MSEHVLLLKVGNALEEGKSAYEATQGNWVLARDKVKNGKIKYVVGIDHKKRHQVVGLYEPKMWYEVVWIAENINNREMPRFRFEGIESTTYTVDDLNKVYDRLLDKFGYGEKAYISLFDLNDLLSSH